MIQQSKLQSSQEQNLSMLESFDFRAIQQQDPSLSSGHRVIYDREVPFEIRIHDPSSGPQEVGTLEGIRVRILVQGEQKIANQVRVELTSQTDLFFHYTHILNEELFKMMQQVQKLTIDFADYPGVLVKMLNSCIKDQHTFLGVFIMQRDGQSRLELIQNAEYKFIQLLSIEFTQSPEQLIRNHISFRYSALKHKVTLMQTRLQDINNLIKIKNPSLLLQLQKGPVTVSTVNKSFR